MHIYIGGAANGKTAYVQKQLAESGQVVTWYEATLPPPGEDAIVVRHLHEWLLQFDGTEEAAIALWKARLANRPVILILTDIGRGIVPMAAKDRAFRDACGRLYQALIAEAEEVTQIWYGIAKQLK